MYAEPTMPNTSFTLCATSVSMNASLGVMRTLPAGLLAGAAARFLCRT